MKKTALSEPFGAWVAPWVTTRQENERRIMPADHLTALRTMVTPASGIAASRPIYCGQLMPVQPGQVIIAALQTTGRFLGITAVGEVTSAPYRPGTQGPYADVDWMIVLPEPAILTPSDVAGLLGSPWQAPHLPTTVSVPEAHLLVDAITSRAGTAATATGAYLTDRIPPLTDAALVTA